MSVTTYTTDTGEPIHRGFVLPTYSSKSHRDGGRAYGSYMRVHPLMIGLCVLFLTLYITKFIRVYFHNASIQNALIQQGEPISCFDISKDFRHANTDNIPSLGDALGAFWNLVGYKQRSTECEDWHKKVNEWNVPDPGDIAVLVVTSFFTQPFYYFMDAMSLTLEAFFSRQSVLVTILIFIFIAYAMKLIMNQQQYYCHPLNYYPYIPFNRDR